MLMIWRGYGWATLIVFGITWVACLLAMQGILEAEYYKANEWPKTIGLIGPQWPQGFLAIT